MPDSPFHPEPSNWFDCTLKWLMPSGTVMRRYIALGILSGVLFVIVTGVLVDRIGGNAQRSATAICAVKEYAEATQDSIPNNPNVMPDAVVRFNKLVADLRATGVKCKPPRVE